MRWLDAILGWLGLHERRRRSTIPPPRIAAKWHEPGKVRRPPPFPRDSAMPIIPIELDQERTEPNRQPSDRRPTLPRRGHHARPRPPKIERGKP